MNIIDLAHQIEDKYRQYLKTSFYFKDPMLRESFEKALKSEYLSKGPYVEATPIFKRGASPKDLFKMLLGYQPDEEFLSAIEIDWLYSHQESSIKKSFEGNNIIVATGTGSGKTESFIYPILLHLYQEFISNSLTPGVRALILYPMNALANDQRERLGAICKLLEENKSKFRFTFGQYIGETPEDENDGYRQAQSRIAHTLPGELVLRSQMRANPPHILLTNYSMLEYLLLRPKDSPLFNAKWWRFIVLDEAHQYRGSRGIEMAMLLRRLKQRLREGGSLNPFLCIATSATLASGESDKQSVADFASNLFGEIFKKDDVIFGETEIIEESGGYKLQYADYSILQKALDNGQLGANSQLVELLSKYDIPYKPEDQNRNLVSRVLLNDRRAIRLRQIITDKPLDVKTIAKKLFNEFSDEKQRISALSDLVNLTIKAKDPGSKIPLLSIRYHQFLRSLEGAFVSYGPDKNEKNVFLDRKSTDGKTGIFEVALCRECGQHYFVGKIKNGKLIEAIRDPSREDFGVTFFRPLENNELNIQEYEEYQKKDGLDLYLLCMECGDIANSTLKCGHNNFLKITKEKSPVDEDRKDQIAKCGACGYSAAGRDPVQEVVHGTDGPNAVIATALYQKLEEGQKKILAFADSRQEAAFFAWYMEESYKDILSRNIIHKALQKGDPLCKEGLSLNSLSVFLANEFGNFFKEKESDDSFMIQAKIWRSLYREYLTDEQRISLEGVGLLRYSIKWPEWYTYPDFLKQSPWSLSKSGGLALMDILLNTMRIDKAVELRTEKSVSVSWDDIGLQTKQMRICIGSPRRPKGAKYWYVRSWDGKTGRRANYLTKILIKSGVTEQSAYSISVETLRELWDFFRCCDEKASSIDDRLIISIDDGKRLNPNWWRLHMIKDDANIFQCDTCNRIQSISVKNVCPRYKCPGTLKEISLTNLSSNHYRNLYLENLPGNLRVEEHTAQLDNERAREFQADFRSGKIHILSCSTTFELGVDLGDLNAIFLRNVPPEAFNYVQRVGRAGRRSGHPGYAITYCRRVPHDLYHYADPERMMSGKVKPPVLSLKNDKIITRHLTATAMSYFFRKYPERFKTVENLFINLKNPVGVSDFQVFLNENRKSLESSLMQIAPPESLEGVGLINGDWIKNISGDDESKFYNVQTEISSDYKNVIYLEKESMEKRDYRTAQWAKKRADTIAREDALSFLSRKAVIPKYGFPVDVVDLDTQRIQTEEARSVSLQRDLSIAISEFAPTSRIIANKNEWVSFGIKKVAEKEWDRRGYKRCFKHNYFVSWKIQEQEPPSEKCCNQMIKGEFIVPQFGFITNREKPKKPSGRTPKVFSTRPYFVRTTKSEPGIIDFGVVKLTKASPGVMAVLCEGRREKGFYICKQCGTGFRKLPKPPHKTPYGGSCRGTLSKQVSLGYEFTTDVLQLQFGGVYIESEKIIEPTWLAFSLAYAIVEGAAESLEVPPTDLSATIAYGAQGHSLSPIIIYDNVPGGAGLVARLEDKDILRACLETARSRVDGKCGCGEDTSCYGCLRSYRNQFVHHNLQRGPVFHFLGKVISMLT